MNFEFCTDYQDMSRKAADAIISGIKKNSGSWVCMATGNSPKGVYNNLKESYTISPGLYGRLGIVKLDEWGGIPMNAANSCETFLQERILEPLHIKKDQYIAFHSDHESPEAECARIQKELQQLNSLDICILGLGKNGHIGFNEPSDVLMPNCHKAQLSHDSLQHQMVEDLDYKPTYGLTLGMGDILRFRKIILLVTGHGKETIFNRLLRPEINPQLPASFLWLHPQVDCFIDLKTVPRV
ncbi:MAG: galactosamine-6-phosphate isomerase [Maribacter sp.]|nr:galactosamine-6-phosphate isomerase [Maribacter sp.]